MEDVGYEEMELLRYFYEECNGQLFDDQVYSYFISNAEYISETFNINKIVQPWDVSMYIVANVNRLMRHINDAECMPPLTEAVYQCRQQYVAKLKAAIEKAVQAGKEAALKKMNKKEEPKKSSPERVDNLLVQDRANAKKQELIKQYGEKAVNEALSKVSKTVKDRAQVMLTKGATSMVTKMLGAQLGKSIGKIIGTGAAGAISGFIGGLADIITAKSPQEKGIAAAKSIVGGIASAFGGPIGMIAGGLLQLIPNRVSTDKTFIVNKTGEDFKSTMKYVGGRGREGFKNRDIKANGGMDHDEYRYAGMYGVQGVKVQVERNNKIAEVYVPSDTSVIVKESKEKPGRTDIYTSKYGSVRTEDEKIGSFELSDMAFAKMLRKLKRFT